VYLEFYGLREKPFNATPDPKFLYMSPGHREALAQLLYGVRENKGFMVLTGDIGTGKTTLLHTLRQRLDGNAAVSYVFNSTLPFDEMLEYVIEDFGISKSGESRAQRLASLYNFLIERRRAGQITVLIIDEAQNLEPVTLEQIRLLSNFETPTEKLLQIILAGQLELRAKLQLPELRQLKQRVGLSCGIPPLTLGETGDYIHARLRIAGTRDLGLFTARAVARIAAYTEGVPRLLNILCDHCLVFGYADHRRRIDRDDVEEAIEYMEDGLREVGRKRGAKGWFRMTWLRRAWAILTLRADFASPTTASRSTGRDSLDR
jgi:general secretion pathway protein A